jgi:hypothetical protein
VLRDQRSDAEMRAYRRAKFAREAELEFKNARETLAQKDSAPSAISIVLSRSNARGIQKSARRPVARTPNRIFCKKKIFCDGCPWRLVGAREVPIPDRIEYGRFAAPHAMRAIDRETS